MRYLSEKQQRTLISVIYTAPYYFLAIAYFLYVTHSQLDFMDKINYQFESKFLCYQVGMLLIISWCTHPRAVLRSWLNRMMIGIYAYLATSLILNFLFYCKYLVQDAPSKKQMLEALLVYTGTSEMHFLYSNIEWLVIAAVSSIICGALCKHLLNKKPRYATSKQTTPIHAKAHSSDG